jgi:hypothetical protein
VQGDRLDKLVVGIGTLVALAIDEEGWRAVHAAAHAAKEVVTNLWLIRPIDERFTQLHLGQGKRTGERKYEWEPELDLIFEESVVHGPELVVRACKFGGLGSGLRVWVNLAQRKMAEGEEKPVAEMLTDKLKDRMRRSTMRAFVISVLDESYRRIEGTASMVMRRYWNSEL